MTTYSIREFKARASEILRNLEDGEEVIITRRGKPCGKLTSMPTSDKKKPSLATLRDTFTDLPDLTFEEIQDGIRDMWKLKPLDYYDAE